MYRKPKSGAGQTYRLLFCSVGFEKLQPRGTEREKESVRVNVCVCVCVCMCVPVCVCVCVF